MRYLVGFLAIFALILGVLLLILRGLGDDTPKDQLVLAKFTATNTVMQMTVQGPVNAEQEHEGIRVTIGRDENRVEILSGYGERVAAAQTFTSNEEAYGTFLRALQLMEYTRGNKDAKLADERGYCPEGNRFIFEIKDGDDQIQRYWQSTCDQGNFGGQTKDIINLFEAQIPEYGSLTGDVKL